MAVTVELNEELAGQLKQQADAVQVSVPEFAIHILENAVLGSSDSHVWKKLNGRRLDLISLEYSQGLSAQEAQELDALQEVVTRASEPEDRQLLKTLDAFEQRTNPSSGTLHE